jgi:hypothetical protein
MEWMSFRAWEVMSLNPAPDGPFSPDKQYRNRHTSGDLASLGNYPAMRQFRDERFTTDHHGFRNSPARETQRPISALVVGDSFTVGSGVTDKDNLTSRIEALSGRLVYNAGATQVPNFPDIARLVHMLDMKRGVVL